uniref:Uncharacterized protein n=1 Tax=Globodera rostochiensis TaxID=31243 RepID=A0A914HJT1_GLORO
MKGRVTARQQRACDDGASSGARRRAEEETNFTVLDHYKSSDICAFITHFPSLHCRITASCALFTGLDYGWREDREAPRSRLFDQPTLNHRRRKRRRRISFVKPQSLLKISSKKWLNNAQKKRFVPFGDTTGAKKKPRQLKEFYFLFIRWLMLEATTLEQKTTTTWTADGPRTEETPTMREQKQMQIGGNNSSG